MKREICEQPTNEFCLKINFFFFKIFFREFQGTFENADGLMGYAED